MGSVVFAGIVPHPPIIVDVVGAGQNDEAKRTVESMKRFAQELKKADPKLIVLITPHGNVFQDAIAIHGEKRLTGNFANFGVSKPLYTVQMDLELQKRIVSVGENNGFSMLEINEPSTKKYRLRKGLDHGVLVPLHFILEAGITARFVVISMALLDWEALYRFGTLVADAIHEGGENVAVIASGDLSHRLTESAPAGYHPSGKAFDEQIADHVKQSRLVDLLAMDEELAEQAGECGLRPILMLAGACDTYHMHLEFADYEGPYGVGYLVAAFTTKPSGESRWSGWKESRLKIDKRRVQQETIFVQLARNSLVHYLKKGKYLSVPNPLPDAFKEQKACFVSLKIRGQLRGCIGTIEPTKKNLAEEIITNSVSAGTRDPRFLPVSLEELQEITLSVDVLSVPESVKGMDELDAKQYGIIVESGRKSGVLLPNLEGVDTAEQQLEIAKSKAGILPRDEVTIYRFRVDRYF